MQQRWTSAEIKNLRLRLGWSIAEFSRRMGVMPDMVEKWEVGSGQATPDDVLQLERLAFHVEGYSEQTSRNAKCEVLMNSQSLEQVHESDVAKNFKSH
jgi:transcriptional regulator with XRE-family HTH domain